MEDRLRLFLLSLLLLLGFNAPAGAADAQDPALSPAEEEPLFQPQVERRQVDVAAIDTEDFELGPFMGYLSIEDFGVNPVYGVHFIYHVSEDFFLDASYGSSKARETSYELLSGGAALLTDDQRNYRYVNFSVGYNLFAGEAYFGDKRAFNSAFYLLGGIGDTEFGGGDRYTVSAGVGYRFVATDWMTVHILFRDHIFQHDLFGEDRTIQNLELQTGLMFLF